MFLYLFISIIFSTITITTPSETELASYYFSTNDIDCSDGITIKWSTTVSNPNNQILAFSSEKGDATIPICYKYNNVYYGTTCGSCASNNTNYPAYSNSTNITMFIPFQGIADSFDSVSSLSVTIGVDCYTSECSSYDTRLDSSTYDTSSSITLNIDNTPPTGYSSDFDVFRSNQSIFIKTFETDNLSDSASGLKYIRFYYVECDEELVKGDNNYQDFIYNASKPWKVGGLENGISYTLGVTVLDEVGNEYPEDDFLGDDDDIEIEPINIEDDSACATPTEVLGFVDNEEKCFIVTEIFGKSSFEVLFFRKFRNKYLLNNIVGEFLVKNYYKSGPYLVQILRRSPLFKFYVYYYLKTIYRMFNA